MSTDTKTGAKSYIRINSRAGESITLSNVNFSSDGARELSNAVSPVVGTLCLHFWFQCVQLDFSVLICVPFTVYKLHF